MIDKTREVALKILYKIEQEKGYSNIVLDEMIKKYKQMLDDRDIGLISEIVYGTITWKLTLDEVIKKYSKIRLKKISPWIINILRMGTYQIIFLDKIPKSAAVNESVNLAKRYGHRSSSNFVNAILRKIEKQDYDSFFEIENDVERISKTTSMPEWIVRRLLKENDVAKVEEICRCSNIKPKINVRVNRLKIKKEELKEILEAENVNFEDSILDDFLIVDNLKQIEHKKSFQDGLYTIQDEAAGLIAYLLQPKEGEMILDACAAPGGKTTYMAEMMKNKGEIDAWDIHSHRLELIENAAKRLSIDIIDTMKQDASIFHEEYYQKYDKILLDVPCLGLGVLKRKPDIKWQKSEEDIAQISNIQKNILNQCAKYLKKGGTLIYSTCSIIKEENDDIIDAFLEKNKNFVIEKEFQNLPKMFQKYQKENGMIQVFQNEKTDGFFICKIKEMQ